MEVILLEKVRNLGGIADRVNVKAGYSRNYLIPYGKAVAATKANIEKYAHLKAELEEKAAESLAAAQKRAETLANIVVEFAVEATEEGRLFGSIGTTAIAKALQDLGHEVQKSEIVLSQGAIRQVGEYDVPLLLHTDVTVNVKVKIAAAK